MVMQSCGLFGGEPGHTTYLTPAEAERSDSIVELEAERAEPWSVRGDCSGKGERSQIGAATRSGPRERICSVYSRTVSANLAPYIILGMLNGARF
jgi:hypothetical protein